MVKKSFLDFRVFIILFIIISGCECCCNKCESYTEGTVTLNINFMNYPNRSASCPIPVSGGDICTNTGENILDIESGLDSDKYLLYVEYESNCNGFAASQAFQSCISEGTCKGFRSVDEGDCDDVWTFRIGLNVTTPDCTPSFPIPISGDQLVFRVYYREPCIQVSDGCESPPPCENPNAIYRPRYESGGIIDFADNVTNYSQAVLMLWTESRCNIPRDCN